MPGKIFVNYRRDDERAFAARVRDRLAQAFGPTNVFMDVDNLMAGQRFDRELEKALAETDVFLSVIGPKWMDLYQQRRATGERDYVHEEIAACLKRGITVIPVLIERAKLPRGDDLPEDIRELVLHQKHDVTHDHFGRDMVELVEAIKFARKPPKGSTRPQIPWGWVSATALTVMAIGYVSAPQLGVPVWVPWSSTPQTTTQNEPIEDATSASVLKAEQAKRAAAEAEVKRQAQEKRAADERSAAAKRAVDDTKAKQAAAEAEKKRIDDIAAETNRKIAEINAKFDTEQVAAKRDAASAEKPGPGQSFRDCNDVCPEMVVVPAGSFTMGDDYGNGLEKPTRTVTIRQTFAVGKFEVTFAEWEACVAGRGCTSNRRPNDQGWGKGRRPVINVSWDDAKQYVAWLSRKSGNSYRLLTEAEWEYAARARGTARWTFGDDEGRLGDFAWYGANSGSRTQPVGGKSANAFGLHDMHGNVWEWVEDCLGEYSDAPSDGSAQTKSCTDRPRVRRGGGWTNTWPGLRSASRGWDSSGFRDNVLGFRVGRTLTP